MGGIVKVFGCRPLAEGCGRDAGAGVRKPPRKETAGRKGAVAAAASYGDLGGVGGDCALVAMIMNGDFEAVDSAKGLSLSSIGSQLSL